MKKRFHKVIGILMTVLLTATMIPILPVAAASHESIRNSVMDVLYGGKSGGSLLCDYHGSGYNGIHEGVDYQLKEGTPIYSIADGTVTRVTNSTSDYVLSTLAIYNSDVNITVVYLHSNAITVKVGDHIKRGDRIAEEGKHGNKIKITPHTHIELRYGKQTSATKSLGDNTASNPDPYPLYEKLGYPLKK